MAATDVLEALQGEVESALTSAGIPWHQQHDLPAYMHQMRTSVAELSRAQEAARAFLNDQRFQHQHRIDTADQLAAEAQKKAQSVLADLQQAAEKVQQQVGTFWQVSKPPSGVSEAMVLDRKADLQRLLDAQAGDGPSVAQAAGRLLEEANASGDQLSAHVLTSLMPLYFQARGASSEMLSAMFAASSPQKAAALGPIVGSKDRAGALNSFIHQARSQVSRTLAQMKADADTVAMEQIGQAASARTFSW